MKRKLILFLYATLFLSCFLFFGPVSVKADEESDLKKQIAEYQEQIASLQKQADSLSQQISLMDKQIKVAALKISQTESQIKVIQEEIDILSGKIVKLDGSLNYLSKVLLERIKETYKSKKFDTLTLFLSSKSFTEFVSRYKYLQTVQLHDRELLLSMEQTRTSYDEQKQLKETKQAELEKLTKQLNSQKIQLNSQIAERKSLLDETKGKEANYQKLLANARAELLAITAILSGEGKETEIRQVTAGERIASVIEGASCNSSGTHLHFMFIQDGNPKNPLEYLKSGVDYENCSTSSCTGGGDLFNPSGSWEWPVSPKITFTQGYGYTWAVQHTWVGRIYQFHNGIDIKGSSQEIRSPKAGTLFQGAFMGKSCTLRYVRVRNDGGIDTYYLHVNY